MSAPAAPPVRAAQPARPVNTKKVTGRREVRYENYEQLVADARAHSGPEVKPLGNWSPGQIFEHIARTLDMSIDGADFALPAPVRWAMSLLMKRKFLYGQLPAGFKSTDAFVADDGITAEAGLASLERAMARQQQESQRAMHPGFGQITRAEWDAFHLRHAELHMSFLTK